MSDQPSGSRLCSWTLNAAFAVFAVVLAIVLAQAGLGFGQQLLVAVLLIVGGSQLSRLTANSLPNFHWPMLAKGAGWVFLVAVLVNSSFVQKPLEAINAANEGLNEVDVRQAWAGSEVSLSRDRTSFTLNHDRPTVLDLSEVPEGVRYNFQSGLNIRAEDGSELTVEDVLEFEYFHEEGTLKGRFKPKPDGFQKIGNRPIEMVAWPRSS